MSVGALDEDGADEAEYEYYDESRGVRVRVFEGERHEYEAEVTLRDDEDAIHASDRCPDCSALVYCRRCADVVEEVREMFDGGGHA